MAKLVKSIFDATRNAGTLRSKVADWSDHLNEKGERMAGKPDLEAYDRFRDRPWGCTFKNLLGEELAKNGLVRILDVGCGKKTTFSNIAFGHDPARFLYTSIDKDPDVNAHICADVFTDMDAIRTRLGSQRFDMLILDIEPHGNETELYDAFKEYMANEYMVVFKCIAAMDMFQTSYADRALRHMMDNGDLVDFFAVSELNEMTRDVFAVGSKDAEFKDEIGASLRIMGGKTTQYRQQDKPFESLVISPGTQGFMRRLLKHGLI